jgi:hypothetical protein
MSSNQLPDRDEAVLNDDALAFTMRSQVAARRSSSNERLIQVHVVSRKPRLADSVELKQGDWLAYRNLICMRREIPTSVECALARRDLYSARTIRAFWPAPDEGMASLVAGGWRRRSRTAWGATRSIVFRSISTRSTPTEPLKSPHRGTQQVHRRRAFPTRLAYTTLGAYTRARWSSLKHPRSRAICPRT